MQKRLILAKRLTRQKMNVRIKIQLNKRITSLKLICNTMHLSLQNQIGSASFRCLYCSFCF